MPYYSKLYLCEQLYLGNFKCECYNNIEEIKNVKRHEYKSFGPLTDTNSTNIMPVCNSVITVIPICKYVPEFLHQFILEWKLNYWQNVKKI